MNVTTFFKKILFTAIGLITIHGFSQNLLVNGNFQSGLNVGYQGGQSPYTYIGPPYSGNSVPGEWTVANNPQTINSNFVSLGDHTTGTGNMMIVDGTTVGGQQRFWKAGNNGGGVCGLTVGLTYTFSYWIHSVYTTSTGTLANIGVQFNNANNVTLVSGSATAPPATNGWQQVVYSFVPTNACVNIEMYDNNTDFTGNDFAIDDMAVFAPTSCPVPTVSVTQQPTCTINTGTIVFTSPLNTGPLPIPSDLFISEVTDESSGALSYIEIFNGTGAPKNLANYKLKIYNNGNATPSNFCDFALSGTLNNNDVYVVAVGSATNMGGVVPDLVVSACPGYNTNDNVRLATSADVEFDLWGRTDGIDFTPLNLAGYTYRRLAAAPHPTMTWNPADWTALDPQDYTDIGTYSYQSTNYQYSIDGVNYQASPTFTGLAPGIYNVTIRDLISGCVSTPIALTVDPIPVPPSSPAVIFCDAANTTATQVAFDFNSIGQNSFDFTYSIDGGAPISGTIPFSPSSYFVTGVSQGQAVTLTITWNGVCTAPMTMTCYPDCVTPVTPTFTQVAPICAGDTLSPLPTTSLNGVTGTWSPALNNTATTTYTFTPSDSGECGTTTTMTIVVNAPVLAITNPPAACAPNTVNLTSAAVTAGSIGGGTLTYWTDAAATIALASPTAVATSGTYYIKSTAGSCFDIEPVVVTINPAPVLTITNPAAVCSPATVDITLPAVTAGSTGGGTLTYWTNAAATTALASPNAVTTSGTYYIKSTVGSCFDIEPVVVTISPAPVLTITNPAAVCSPATVNLTLPAVTAGSTGGGTLTYWTNAAATTVLATPTAVTTSGTYYIKSTVGSCFDIEPVIVTINPSPVLTITNPAAVCSPATVDITLPAVTAGSTGGGTLTYWTNASATTALASPNAVTTSGTYYIKSTVGSCFDIEPVVVTISPAPVLTITNPAAVCAPATVNLTLPAVTAGSTGSGTLTYWTNAAATTALASPNAVATSGTYYIKSTVGSCFDIEPVTVTINPSPVLTITNPAAVCSPATVNLTLSSVTAGSTGGGVLTYWTNAAATLPLTTPTAVATSGTYYIKSTVGSCSDIEPVTVTINPTVTPTFNISQSVICSGAVITPLPTTSLNGISGTWTPALNNTATTTYTFNPVSSIAVPCPVSVTFQIEVIPQIDPVISIVESCNSNSVTVTNPIGFNYEYSLDGGPYQSNPIFYDLSAGAHSIVALQTTANCTSNATNFTINVVANDVIVNNPQPLHYCDPSNDGFVTFDLSQIINSVTGGNPYSVTFHETITDAETGGTPIPDIINYDNINPWSQLIYIRVESNTSSCFEIVPLQLIVDPTPEATEPDDYVLCDYIGQTGFESFDLTTTVPQVLGTIDPATVTVTFHTTFTDAQDDANAIGGVTNYINQTQWNQTVYVRVEFNTTGCYDIVELDLIVNPLPNATQPNYPQYTLCDYNGAVGYETFDLVSQVAPILLGQTGMAVTFYPSLTDAQNDTNAINISHPDLQYPNQIIYVQTLGIRITNNTTGCYSISTMDIRVVPLPSPIPPTEPYTVCDDDQDGFSCEFDLASLLPDLLNGITTYSITFHETLTDAQIGSTPIDSSIPYCSIIPFVQTIYVRTVDTNTGCWSVIPIELNVNPSPIAPVDLDDIVVCDEDNNTQNAITTVDLTVNTPDVLAQQPLASSNYVVTYYNSEAEALLGTSPIINDTNYTATNGETIWVRVENITTGCFNIGSFDIIINIPLLLSVPAPLAVCDADANPNDQFHSFDLTVKDAEITQGLSGYTVTYYPSLSDAQNGTNVIVTPTAYINEIPPVQTLGVVVTSAAGCQSITTLDIRVLPIPTPNTNPNPLAPLCDDNNPGDMLEVFDVTVNAAYIANGDPNVTLTYYTSEADALVPQFPIADPTQALVGDNVWIRVENNRVDYLGNHCFVLVEQALTVNPLPEVVQPLAPYRMCDDNTDGIAQFDLTNSDLAIAILGANQSPADFTITYYLTAAGANPFTNTGETPLVSPYTNVTADTQDIYIRVVNNATGCVNATGVLTLAVEEYATATGPQAFSSCDDYNDPYDGVFQLDLTQFNAAILGTQDPTIFLISYYHSQADAEAGINAIPLAEAQAYITAPDTDQIWVKVENSSNSIVPFCYALTTIDIEIERYPNPIITTPNNVNTICVDFISGVVVRPLTLDSGIANPADYTFEWYEDGTLIPGATASTYTVDTASATGATRNYHVRVISNSPLLCETTSADFPVIQSGPAVAAAGGVGYTVTNAFTNSQIITVTVEGWGTYEYSLDDGPRQASNIFEGVSLGSHTIHVWDTEGGVAFSCEELTILDVMVIDYPRYFTPNGDGFHDTWNVVGLSNFADQTKIYIFDRYGKLLKQLSASDQSEGWDGTYNGKPLPSTDYWFTVDFPEQGAMKQFKAHFSLKR